MKLDKCYCVILAGGVGRRLWPYSRKNRPKQFLDILGVGRTLLQQTYDRFAMFIPKENIFVSTFVDYVEWVNEQLPEVDEEHILAEPVQLSTAPAVAWATYNIANLCPEANIIVSPSDQLIMNPARFVEQMKESLEIVDRQPSFIATGVKPTVPNTRYGYIQMGENDGNNCWKVMSFTEKPGQEFANTFVSSGEFLWNTGLFLFNSKVMLKHLSENMPIMRQYIEGNGNKMSAYEELELVKKYYPSNLRQSIDLMILEQTNNVFVRESDFGWADIGGWTELHEIEKKDADGNAVVASPDVMFVSSRDNIVCVPKGMKAAIQDLDGYVVAINDGVLVVCPNDDPSRIRRLVNEAQMQLGNDVV